MFFVDSSGEVRSLRKTISDVTVGGDLEPLSAPITEQARFVSLSSSTTGVRRLSLTSSTVTCGSGDLKGLTTAGSRSVGRTTLNEACGPAHTT